MENELIYCACGCRRRSEYFAKYGWKTIFIRTEEVLDKNWKEICSNKIKLKIGVK